MLHFNLILISIWAIISINTVQSSQQDISEGIRSINISLSIGNINIRSKRAAWDLPEPKLEIVNDKIKVTVIGPRNLKKVKFFMSINEDFSNLKEAKYKFELKCKNEGNGKKCSRRAGPVIKQSDVVYYSVIAKVKRKKVMKLLNQIWFPSLTATSTTTTTTTTAPPPPEPNSCNSLSGPLPNGCSEYNYDVTNDSEPQLGRGNPERGFYKFTQTKTSEYSPVAEQQLNEWAAQGFTLIYRNFVLDTFVNSDISDVILQNIQDDFDVVREAALKVILRFCYTVDQDNIEDAKPLQLTRHIEQLKPILQANYDVIALVHTGFIGVWGEWYYTANYGNEGIISEEDYENRRQVVEKLLDALPEKRQIQLRTPKYKTTILNRATPVTSEEAHTDAAVARIGHHNDCFLASDTDYGTYEDKKVQYPYLQQDTLYVVQGGESCNLNPPRSDCPTALKELSELHYTYINSYYHPDVIQGWKDQGCFQQIELHIGYRLMGIKSRLPIVMEPGTSENVVLRVNNTGWAAPINKRSAQLLIRHVSTGQEYQSPIDSYVNLQNWVPGNHDITLELQVPPSAISGDYKVLLKLPDGEESLQDKPEYNIVMENLKNTEDTNARLNFLGNVAVVPTSL